MKKSRRTYNGVHLNKKSNTQDVVEQSLTFLLFMVQYYGDIIRPLVTQPLSNRQKKTENANLRQKNSREALSPAIL